MDPQRQRKFSPFFGRERAVVAHSRPTLSSMSSPLVLETVVTPGRGLRDLVFISAVLLAGVGAYLSVAMREPASLFLVLVGIVTFVWLVKSEPKAVYAEYLRIDAGGIKYSHMPNASRRVSRYNWNEIERIELSSDPNGISVFTRRPGLQGIGIFLLAHTHADAQSAFSTANEQLKSCQQ